MTEPIIDGLCQFQAVHPEWTEEEAGEDGWDESVAWWAVAAAAGLVLIDPLVDDWDAVDRLVADAGGCAGVVRTCHWHERSVADAARRYGVDVWARRDSGRRVGDRDEIFDTWQVIDVERADELALWLPRQRALIFGDAMIRTQTGELRVCPESWTQPAGGAARLRAVLAGLAELPIEHVLVAHGPLVLGDGLAALRTATD